MEGNMDPTENSGDVNNSNNNFYNNNDVNRINGSSSNNTNYIGRNVFVQTSTVVSLDKSDKKFFYPCLFLGVFAICSLATGTICSSLALKTCALFALSLLPIVTGKQMEKFFELFYPTKNFTFGFGRAGILIQFFCHIGTLFLAGLLIYSSILQYFFYKPLPPFNMLFTIITAILMALSLGFVSYISIFDKRQIVKPKKTFVINALQNSTEQLVDSKSIDETTTTSSSSSTTSSQWNRTFLLWIFCGSNVLLFIFSIVAKEQISWRPVDSIWCFLFCVLLILINVWELYPLLCVLLSACPSNYDIELISKSLRTNFPEILNIHNVRIWKISTFQTIILLHVVIDDLSSRPGGDILVDFINYLKKHYKFDLVTVQLENSMTF